MGKLIDQPIKSLFNGVSRQPDSVRLPSQIESADNTLLSVVTGGFEKRPPTTHIRNLTELDATLEYAVHVIDRDATEKYLVVIGDDTIKVFDLLTGVAKTVNTLTADAVAYLTGSPHDFAFVTVADYTFVVNRTVEVELKTATSGTVQGTVQEFGDLPGSPTLGHIYKIAGDPTSTFDDYYVKWSGSVWEETVNPNGQNSLDEETMPYQLVRQGDGTFNFEKATWASRPVGDETSVPAPSFVGSTISDVFFFRGRLGIAADESLEYSQAGDVFNFWPEKAFQEVASDPIEQTASTNKVTILRHVEPFRKSLFVTSDTVQFEVSATERFTPTSAVMDVTTSYEVDTMARPVVMGDQLYFPAKQAGAGLIYEYFYDGDTFSNTAADITKHATGYLPPNTRMLIPVSAGNRLFVLPDDERNHLYVYTFYWDGEKKVQSAWCRYVFASDDLGAYIYGGAALGGYLYLLIARDDEVCLERVAVEREFAITGLGFNPLLDRRTSLTGSYDAGTNQTTWTTPYEHGDAVSVMLGESFTGNAGRLLNVLYPTATTVTATGDYSAHDAYVGIPYEMRVKLSKQYVRDEQGSPITVGRLQLLYFVFNFADTGYFEVHVTPQARTAKVWKQRGFVVGSSNSVVGTPAIVTRGTKRVKVKSRADTVDVEIVNDTPLPSVITGATWTGFYNNVTLQG